MAHPRTRRRANDRTEGAYGAVAVGPVPRAPGRNDDLGPMTHERGTRSGRPSWRGRGSSWTPPTTPSSRTSPPRGPTTPPQDPRRPTRRHQARHRRRAAARRRSRRTARRRSHRRQAHPRSQLHQREDDARLLRSTATGWSHGERARPVPSPWRHPRPGVLRAADQFPGNRVEGAADLDVDVRADHRRRPAGQHERGRRVPRLEGWGGPLPAAGGSLP